MVCVLDSCSILNLLNSFADERILKNITKVFEQVYVSKYVYDKEIFNKTHRYKDWHNDVYNLYYNAGIEKFRYLDGLNDVENFVNKFCKRNAINFKKDGEYYSTLTALQISRFNLPDSDFNSKLQRVLLVTDDAPAKADYDFLFENNQIGSIISSVDLVIILYIKNVIKNIKEVKDYISNCITLYNRELTDFHIELKKLASNSRNIKENQLITNLIGLLNDNDYEQIQSTPKNPQYRDFYKNNPAIKVKIAELKNLTFKTKIPELRERKKSIHRDLIWKI